MVETLYCWDAKNPTVTTVETYAGSDLSPAVDVPSDVPEVDPTSIDEILRRAHAQMEETMQLLETTPDYLVGSGKGHTAPTNETREEILRDRPGWPEHVGSRAVAFH